MKNRQSRIDRPHGREPGHVGIQARAGTIELFIRERVRHDQDVGLDG